ncbi:hypothetical protein BKI52_28705 [marine bacterium AO1-C]|nr:hypothetical protein BKI52_28705 [marine bacterium AO1-C]
MKTIYLSVILLCISPILWAQTPQTNKFTKAEKVKGSYHARFKEDSTKTRFNAKLDIENFFSFDFIATNKDLDCRVSLGQWTTKGDTLILESYPKKQLPDKYQFQLLFCKWYEFPRIRFLIKENKLVRLYRNRRGKWRKGKVYRKEKK